MHRDSDGKLAVVGGLRVEDGDGIAAGLQDVLVRLQGKDDIGDVEVGANEHAGVSFHRIEFNKPDASALELFGSGPGLTFGSGTRTVWACVGGDKSFDTLKGVMDTLEAAYENPVDREPPASMRLVANFTQLKNLIEGAEAAKRKARAAEKGEGEASDVPSKTGDAQPGTPTPSAKGKTPADGFRPDGNGRRRGGRGRRGAWIQEYFSSLPATLEEGEDRIQMDVRPTDKGMRGRLHFDMGFVRNLGRVLGPRMTGEK